MSKRYLKKLIAGGLGVGAAVLSGMASAAIDTTTVVAKLGEGGTAVEAIGMAALVVIAGAAVFKYVRRAF
jgi:hypothetical protein